ncbi:MAG TPA: tRNA lysidine(34) synthetase TilS [Terriglobia bacterium]|nr:tRNA lysidine(34) synthetase TilS [Terriglobia bacterium]
MKIQSAREARLSHGVPARWRAAMRQAGFFQAGERVGVAVSGGADSVLLLDYMEALGRELGFRLAVVHFNHCLRGAESEADERFVRERARELGLDFLGARADVARAARERKKNLEATARELRYRFFFSLVRQGKCDKVATAHTANDQAETVLLRLLRGAGTRGLGGIHPTLEGGVVRPFLSLTRAEVESEVARRGLPFRNDSSNRDTRFKRNRLRSEVMPLLEKEFNPQMVPNLSGFADRARDDEAFLEAQARERSRPWIVREARALKIPVGRLNEFPPAIARRLLRQMFAEMGPVTRASTQQTASGETALRDRGHRTPTYADIESVRRLAQNGQSGKRLLIASTLEARKDFEWLVICRAVEAGARSGPGRGFAYEIRPPAEVSVPELDLRLRFRIADNMGAKLTQESYTVWLKAGELEEPLILRNFRPGDCVYRSGHSSPSKLKEMFQRRRVPREQRAYWPVLECKGKIIWTRGFDMPPDGGDSGPEGRQLIVIEESSMSGWSSGK